MPINDIDINEAVLTAFRASFGLDRGDLVVNPDRRCIPPARFVLELARAGWTVQGVEDARISLEAVLEDADDEAFDEGDCELDDDGNDVGTRNTWSSETFVATCAAKGITFAKAA